MENIKIKAQKRTDVGGGHVKRLRKRGIVPAVIYGKDIESSPTQVSMSDLRRLVATGGRNAFFTLEMDDMEHAAIIKSIQYDVINSDVLHVDIQKVSLDEKIQLSVAIRIVGREKVETGNKVIIQNLDEITIACFPQDAINYLDVDVSDLDAGDSLRVADLKVPENMDILNDADEVVVSVTEVRETVEPAAEEESEDVETTEGETEQEE
jgi:large subunit ribosomal protein L25